MQSAESLNIPDNSPSVSSVTFLSCLPVEQERGKSIDKVKQNVISCDRMRKI